MSWKPISIWIIYVSSFSDCFFIYSTYILNCYSVPGTVLGTRRAGYEQEMKSLLSWSIHSRVGINKTKTKWSVSDKSSEFGPE